MVHVVPVRDRVSNADAIRKFMAETMCTPVVYATIETLRKALPIHLPYPVDGFSAEHVMHLRDSIVLDGFRYVASDHLDIGITRIEIADDVMVLVRT